MVFERDDAALVQPVWEDGVAAGGALHDDAAGADEGAAEDWSGVHYECVR